jgi:hypothetical protein
MAKLNPLDLQGKKLFNLKSLNELKKDLTNIKIFKNSFFDSNFNSVQSLNTNLSQLPLKRRTAFGSKPGGAQPLDHLVASKSTKNKNPKFSTIIRAIRSIRLSRDEVKLIRYVILLEKKIKKIIRISPIYGRPSLTPLPLGRGVLSDKKIGARGGFFSKFSKKELYKKEIIKLKEIKKLKRKLTLDLVKIKKPANEKKIFKIKAQQNKIFSYNNIINKNILLRNMKYNFLKSTLSSILKKKITRISEVLEDKPIKNYVLYSYLKNCIFSPPHLNGGRTKLSLNKYKGRKLGSFINYNNIIGYKFNSISYQTSTNYLAHFLPTASIGGKNSTIPSNGATLPATPSIPLLPKGTRDSYGGTRDGLMAGQNGRADIYIKDTYKLLFYLFKSMYCLISKPVLKYTNDKVTIQLFYYLNIPKKKIFRLFYFFYFNSIKKKWLAQMGEEKKKFNFNSISKGQHSSPFSRLSAPSPLLCSEGAKGSKGSKGREEGMLRTRSNSKIYIRWKLRKAISRFKNKNIPSKNLLFKLRKFNLTANAVFQNKFKLICAILSNKFNKPVELQLIRLHHPYHDSNILVNLLSLNIKNKRKKARVAVQKIYNKKPVKNLNDPILNNPLLRSNSPFPWGPLGADLRDGSIRTASRLRKGVEGGTGNILPAFLSGLNIKIAGRLMGEPIIPRITTKIFGKGASATGKVNYLDVARITKKNRKGAYTIKITSGQNFF